MTPESEISIQKGMSIFSKNYNFGEKVGNKEFELNKSTNKLYEYKSYFMYQIDDESIHLEDTEQK